MARRKVSQLSARYYKRELEKLQTETRAACSTLEQPQLACLNLAELHEIRGILLGAKKMGHPLACKLVDNYLYVHGVR